MASKDAKFFNVSEKHEMDQVCRKYQDPEAVKLFIRQKAAEGVIKYWTHTKLADFLAENGFKRVQKAKSLTMEELTKRIHEKGGLGKGEAAGVLGAFIGSLKDALAAGESVELRGFGSFRVVERSARKGRNPQTGEEIDIPAKKAVVFVPAKILKENVAAGASQEVNA